MATTVFTSVPYGPYFGFTRAELERELARYKSEVKRRSDFGVTASSSGGKSFTFGPTGNWSLARWASELQQAFAFVNPSATYFATDTAVADFT